MQPIHLIRRDLSRYVEAAKTYPCAETHQHHFAIRLRLNQQVCIGKGNTEQEALAEAESRAVAYLQGAGIWNEEAKNNLVSFSTALEHLKAGKKVARQGWNGKDQWLSVSCPETRQVPAKGFWSPHNAEYAESNGGFAEVAPCITLKNAQGQIVMGWIPSTGDLFAEDWVIL